MYRKTTYRPKGALRGPGLRKAGPKGQAHPKGKKSPLVKCKLVLLLSPFQGMETPYDHWKTVNPSKRLKKRESQKSRPHAGKMTANGELAAAPRLATSILSVAQMCNQQTNNKTQSPDSPCSEVSEDKRTSTQSCQAQKDSIATSAPSSKNTNASQTRGSTPTPKLERHATTPSPKKQNKQKAGIKQTQTTRANHNNILAKPVQNYGKNNTVRTTIYTNIYNHTHTQTPGTNTRTETKPPLEEGLFQGFGWPVFACASGPGAPPAWP